MFNKHTANKLLLNIYIRMCIITVIQNYSRQLAVFNWMPRACCARNRHCWMLWQTTKYGSINCVSHTDIQPKLFDNIKIWSQFHLLRRKEVAESYASTLEHPSGDSCGKGAVAPRVWHSESWQLARQYQYSLNIGPREVTPPTEIVYNFGVACMSNQTCVHREYKKSLELNRVSRRRS